MTQNNSAGGNLGMPLGIWVRVDDTRQAGDTAKIDRGRPEEVGKYDVNNAMIAVVDRDGAIYVAASSSFTVAAAKRAGYTRGDVWVPLSNAQSAVPAINETIERSGVHAVQVRNNHFESPQAYVEPGNVWVRVDGYDHAPNSGEFASIPRGEQDSGGLYGVNDNFIAGVTPEGRTYVAGKSAANVAAAQRAGYVDGRCAVTVPVTGFDFKYKETNDLLERSVVAAGPRTELLAQATAAQAGKVRGIPSGPWVRVDDTDVLTNDGAKYRVPKGLPSQFGHMESNDGKLVVVDTDGAVYITAASDMALQEAQRAGYVGNALYADAPDPGTIGVPLSNGRSAQLRINEFIDNAYRIRTAERALEARKDLAAAFELRTQHAASDRSPGRTWVKVDGLGYTTPDGQTTTLPGSQDPSRQAELVDQVGTYNQQNGRVALVDGLGQTWVAFDGAAAQNDLRTGGYRESSLYVPFANGETPVNSSVTDALAASEAGRNVVVIDTPAPPARVSARELG